MTGHFAARPQWDFARHPPARRRISGGLSPDDLNLRGVMSFFVFADRTTGIIEEL